VSIPQGIEFLQQKSEQDIFSCYGVVLSMESNKQAMVLSAASVTLWRTFSSKRVSSAHSYTSYRSKVSFCSIWFTWITSFLSIPNVFQYLLQIRYIRLFCSFKDDNDFFVVYVYVNASFNTPEEKDVKSHSGLVILQNCTPIVLYPRDKHCNLKLLKALLLHQSLRGRWIFVGTWASN